MPHILPRLLCSVPALSLGHAKMRTALRTQWALFLVISLFLPVLAVASDSPDPFQCETSPVCALDDSLSLTVDQATLITEIDESPLYPAPVERHEPLWSAVFIPAMPHRGPPHPSQ